MTPPDLTTPASVREYLAEVKRQELLKVLHGNCFRILAFVLERLAEVLEENERLRATLTNQET